MLRHGSTICSRFRWRKDSGGSLNTPLAAGRFEVCPCTFGSNGYWVSKYVCSTNQFVSATPESETGGRERDSVGSSVGILVVLFLLFGALGAAAPVPTEAALPDDGALGAAPESSSKKTCLLADAARDDCLD